ncbi:MAG: hypothetical protein Q4F57_04005 [Weeksellaceae bacterium]|nr:hypothetical protein [Weeksellaceae bacterium]
MENRGYFIFGLLMIRIISHNILVTRSKLNTLYYNLEEKELPKDRDHDILRDEIIMLSSTKAMAKNINKRNLRLAHVYKEDENQFIEIITNQLEWSAITIADLYGFNLLSIAYTDQKVIL